MSHHGPSDSSSNRSVGMRISCSAVVLSRNALPLILTYKPIASNASCYYALPLKLCTTPCHDCDFSTSCTLSFSWSCFWDITDKFLYLIGSISWTDRTRCTDYLHYYCKMATSLIPHSREWNINGRCSGAKARSCSRKKNYCTSLGQYDSYALSNPISPFPMTTSRLATISSFKSYKRRCMLNVLFCTSYMVHGMSLTRL